MIVSSANSVDELNELVADIRDNRSVEFCGTCAILNESSGKSVSAEAIEVLRIAKYKKSMLGK